MIKWLIPLVALVLILSTQSVSSCNEAICGGIVSKCLLTQSCNCDYKNCTCCKECSSCLSDLFIDCCSCVDMCPKSTDKPTSLNRKSNVEDIQDPTPSLFKILTEHPDDLERWTSITFPVDIDIKDYAMKEYKFSKKDAEQDVLPKSSIISMNCTVAFWPDCMSWRSCKESCTAMGANKIRWFHDGCCECVGENCINYGLNESRCKNCAQYKEKEIDNEIDAEVEFDEEEEDED